MRSPDSWPLRPLWQFATVDVLNRLASSLGRNDEHPNIALAEAIVKKGDAKAVRELVEALLGKDVVEDLRQPAVHRGTRRDTAKPPHSRHPPPRPIPSRPVSIVPMPTQQPTPLPALMGLHPSPGMNDHSGRPIRPHTDIFAPPPADPPRHPFRNTAPNVPLQPAG